MLILIPEGSNSEKFGEVHTLIHILSAPKSRDFCNCNCVQMSLCLRGAGIASISGLWWKFGISLQFGPCDATAEFSYDLALAMENRCDCDLRLWRAQPMCGHPHNCV